MKNLKKVMALIIAMVMVLGMATSAFADDEATATGSITIKSNDTVSVDGRSFTAYKLLDAIFSEDGANVSYTIPGEDDGTLATFYDTHFTTTTTDDDDNEVTTTGKEAAAVAGITFDQYVAEQIEAMTDAATLQDFITKALAAVTADGVEDVTVLGPVTGENGDAEFTELESGYYLIADTTDPEVEPVSSLMLDTVNDANVDITIKANSPQPDKVIISAEEVEDDESTDEVESGYSETEVKANNVGIGDTVYYRLTEQVPNWKGYDYFYFILNDTLSEGLTFNNDIVVKAYKADNTTAASDDNPEIFVVDRNGTYYATSTTENGYTEDATDTGISDSVTKYTRYVYQTLTAGTDYYVYLATDDATDDGHTFEIAFENIMDYAVDTDIVVTYSANLNADAVTGIDPNTNTATSTYSNNPSKSERDDGEGEDETPGKPADTTNHPVGESPASITNTYTTELDITKYDTTTGENVALADVEFTLTGTKEVVTVENKDYFTQDDAGTYYLLTDGTYTETAPITEAYMNKIASTGDAAVDEGYVVTTDETEAVYTIDDVMYREFDPDTDINTSTNVLTVDVYELIETNTDDYTSIDIMYSKTTVSEITKSEVDVKMVGTTGEDGLLNFKDLSEGTYTLSETGTPDGYNTVADITFTITWVEPDLGETITGEEQCSWEKTTDDSSVNDDDITYDESTGYFKVTIENKMGTELPETGGIGTTIFYLVGAILVIGGGVVLITRRRMSAR